MFSEIVVWATFIITLIARAATSSQAMVFLANVTVVIGQISTLGSILAFNWVSRVLGDLLSGWSWIKLLTTLVTIAAPILYFLYWEQLTLAVATIRRINRKTAGAHLQKRNVRRAGAVVPLHYEASPHRYALPSASKSRVWPFFEKLSGWVLGQPRVWHLHTYFYLSAPAGTPDVRAVNCRSCNFIYQMQRHSGTLVDELKGVSGEIAWDSHLLAALEGLYPKDVPVTAERLWSTLQRLSPFVNIPEESLRTIQEGTILRFFYGQLDQVGHFPMPPSIAE